MRGFPQQRLALAQASSHERGDFVVSPANAEAVAAVDAWPAWPGGLLTLVGPEGSGKTHLARGWARRAAAAIFSPGDRDVAALRRRPVLVEDADRRASDETLFHLINMAPGGGLLLTARLAPREWATALPDLRSRLDAAPVAKIGPPDDAVLEGVMRKLFRERNIRAPDDVLAYLIRRIERSIPSAQDVVCRLDERADAEKRDITRALAREVLEPEDATLDLFNS
ncbi:MAG: chromosomal replication initiator DnaA [Caulobacteraceae bacterium]